MAQISIKTDEKCSFIAIFSSFPILIRFFLLILQRKYNKVISVKIQKMDKKHFDIDFRAATLKDFEECMDLINQARQQMIESGLHQWTGGYPSESDILADINNGVAQVLTIDKKIAVYGAVILNGEEKYNSIQGTWKTYGNYYAIHRLATLPELQREGFAQVFIKKVKGLCEVECIPSIKVDTHIKNLKMVKLLSSMGFCYCGTVDYGARGKRIAFEYVTLNEKEENIY